MSDSSLLGRGCCLMRLDGRANPAGRSGMAGLLFLSIDATFKITLLLSLLALRNSTESSNENKNHKLNK